MTLISPSDGIRARPRAYHARRCTGPAPNFPTSNMPARPFQPQSAGQSSSRHAELARSTCYAHTRWPDLRLVACCYH